MNTLTKKNISRLTALVTVSLLALTGCAGAAEPVEATPAGDSVTIADGWIKATDEDMSAAFGTLTNSGSSDVTVVSAQTDVAGMVELHETVENEAGEMIMREIEGGFSIPADGSLLLEPGADHIMLMGLTGPLTAGDEVTVTLTFSDDSTYEFTAPVKDYSGANETYEEGDEHEGMDH